MSQSTVNIQRLKQTGETLTNISAHISQNERALEEIMQSLGNNWKGEAATTYLNAYKQNAPELAAMAKLLMATSQTLTQIATSYTKQESSVADLIRSTLPKG